MFKKILIANRGEIAVRIIRTCKRMGIQTVAVYSEADSTSLHVQEADASVFIGESRATESYLVAEKIIDAAQKTGCQAIHPGYGFLSENAGFCEKASRPGMVFIGPPAGAERGCGSYSARRKWARRSPPVPDVPASVPGQFCLGRLLRHYPGF